MPISFIISYIHYKIIENFLAAWFVRKMKIFQKEFISDLYSFIKKLSVLNLLSNDV